MTSTVSTASSNPATQAAGPTPVRPHGHRTLPELPQFPGSGLPGVVLIPVAAISCSCFMTRPGNGMAAGVIVEDRAWLGKLDGELRGELAPVFAQASSRLTAFSYIGALLAEPGDRKSCWQLAERAGHATPRRMQALLAEYAWDWKAALAALQRFIVARLGDPEAIVVLDETAELKKGTATVI